MTGIGRTVFLATIILIGYSIGTTSPCCGNETASGFHSGYVDSFDISTDGKTIASGGRDATIRLWDIASRRELQVYKVTDSVNNLLFSPDNKTLFAAFNLNIASWDLASTKKLVELTDNQEGFSKISLSVHGNVLASVGFGRIRIFDGSGKELFTWTGTSTINCMALFADGRTLATADDNSIKLWEVASGKQLHSLVGHDDYVRCISVSRDGKTLASGSEDKSIKLWEIDALKLTRTISTEGGVDTVSISADGSTLASRSAYKTIQLWDTSSGKEIRTLPVLNECSSIKLSADGKMVAALMADSVFIWEVDSGKELYRLTIAKLEE